MKIIVLSVAVALTSSGTAVAAESTAPTSSNTSIQTSYVSSSPNNIVISDEGINIDGTFYTQEEFREALEHAIALNSEQPSGVSTRAVAAAAGVYFIPRHR